MSQPLRILHLVTSLAVGGGEGLVLGLAGHTSAERAQLHVGVLREISGPSLLPDLEQTGAQIVRFRSRGLYNPQAYRRVMRYAREQRIDLIHTHLLVADVIGRIAGALLGIPVVSTLQNEPRSLAQLRRDRRWMAKTTALGLPTNLVVVSDTVRREYASQWGVADARMRVIHNAVPVERYLALEPRAVAPDEAPLIVNIGRLHPQKAQHILLEAARIVLASHPRARFLIVGQGPLEQQLRDHAEELGISGSVTFAGLRRDIDAVLAQADIFALSSLWEGLSLAAVEAMAAARPVVLTDVGGARELVEDGVHGRIVAPGSPEALAGALVELIDHPERRLQLGAAARERVRHDFSITAIARQYEDLYEELCAARVRHVGMER